MLIARYPKRIAKKTEVNPDKPCFSVADVAALLGAVAGGRLSGSLSVRRAYSFCYGLRRCISEGGV
jgi:hypothetical protein